MDTRQQARPPEATLPLVNIVGEKVALGPLRKDLIPIYTRWYNDFNTLRTLDAMPVPLAVELIEKWYERVIQRGETEIAFTVYARDTMRPIGNTGLNDIDYRNRTAEFGITIGESDARGKGYGTETAQLMLGYAFTVLGLHNVMLTVHEYNPAGIRAYTKAGFQEFRSPSREHIHGRQTLGRNPHGMLSDGVGPKPRARRNLQARRTAPETLAVAAVRPRHLTVHPRALTTRPRHLTVRPEPVEGQTVSTPRPQPLRGRSHFDPSASSGQAKLSTNGIFTVLPTKLECAMHPPRTFTQVGLK